VPKLSVYDWNTLQQAGELLREANIDAHRYGVHIDPEFFGWRVWAKIEPEPENGRLLLYGDGETLGEAYENLLGKL